MPGLIYNPGGELSLKTGAAVASYMQYLVHKAETGEEISEHESALRMLAATVTPNLSSRSLLRAAEPSPSAAAGDKPSLDDLMAILGAETKPPKEQVADGQAPSVPVIAVVPEANYMKGDIEKNYKSLLDSQSLCQLYASLFQLKNNPQGWNITQDGQAVLAFSAQAQYAWQAMTGPLAGFFIFSQGTQSNYSQSLDKGAIHDGFLGQVFGGFGFDKDTQKQLDDLLTGFTSSLGSVPLGGGSQKTIDHVIRLNLVPRINVAGDDDNPEYVYQPTTTVLYLKINANSYTQAVGKHNTAEKVDFKMDMTIFKCQFNADLFEKSRAKFDKVFQMLTNKSMSAFTDMFVKKVVSKDANPK